MPPSEQSPIDTIITIRSDGSAAVTEYDRDEDVIETRTISFENPDGLDMASVIANYLVGNLVVPDNVARVTVREDDGRGAGANIVYLPGAEAAK